MGPEPADGSRARSRRARPYRRAFEQNNRPKVMTPWEVQRHIQYIFDHVPPGSAIRPIAKRLDRFVSGWHGAWAQFGTSDEGLPAYFSLIERVRDDIRSLNAQDI